MAHIEEIVTPQDSSPPSVVRKSFLLRAWQPAAAMPAAKNDASRRRRRGIKHLSSYKKFEEE